MHSPTLFPLIRVGIVAIGVVILLLSTFLMRPWTFAPWVKGAFWLLALVGLAWSAVRCVLLSHVHFASRETYLFLHAIQPFLLWTAAGVLLLFLFSGEAYRGWRRWEELKHIRDHATPKA